MVRAEGNTRLTRTFVAYCPPRGKPVVVAECAGWYEASRAVVEFRSISGGRYVLVDDLKGTDLDLATGWDGTPKFLKVFHKPSTPLTMTAYQPPKPVPVLPKLAGEQLLRLTEDAAIGLTARQSAAEWPFQNPMGEYAVRSLRSFLAPWVERFRVVGHGAICDLRAEFLEAYR